jgi:hypothetical protein
MNPYLKALLKYGVPAVCLAYGLHYFFPSLSLFFCIGIPLFLAGLWVLFSSDMWIF